MRREVVSGVQVDGADVCSVRPLGLPIYGALVQVGVLATGRVHGVQVDHRHRLVQHLHVGLTLVRGQDNEYFVG